MSACPKWSNANVHPAQVLLNSTTKQCTPAQVKADNQEAAAASTSAAKVEAQWQNKKSVHVTQLEDSAQVTDVANKQQAIRPDLHMSVSEKQVVSNTTPIPMGGISGIEGGIRKNGLTYRVSHPPSVASMRAETGIEVPDTHNNGFSDGNSSFPPESMADSKSDGMAVSDVDKDKDKDFVMEQTKSEAPCGTFRLEVQGLCQEAPVSGAVIETSSDKHTFKEVTLNDAPIAKCSKKSEGGLMANWKKLVNYNSTNASSTQKTAPQKSATQRLIPAKDVNTEIVEGKFDHEDTSEALAAMRASKPSMVKVRDSQKAMLVAVKIVDKPVTNVDTASQQKCVKFTINALPFPSGPQIIHMIWNDNFRELDMEAHPQQNSGTPLEAVTSIAGDVLTDWQSTIGMNMFDVLGALFAEHNLNKDEIVAFVPHALDGFRFIYADPDAPPNEKGGFKSDLILNLFVYHFKKTNNSPRLYGSQAGGLGLCTAAMERALFLWRFGENPIKDDRGNKRKNIPQFNESDWGSKTCGWTKSAP